MKTTALLLIIAGVIIISTTKIFTLGIVLIAVAIYLLRGPNKPKEKDKPPAQYSEFDFYKTAADVENKLKEDR